MTDSAIPMLLFLGFLFVSLTLILGLGIVSREDERAAEAAARAAAEEAAARPIHDGTLAATPATDRGALDGERRFLLDAVEVGGPSELSDGAASLDELVRQLEDFLREEASSVADFVSAPSIGGLLCDGGSGGRFEIPQRDRGRRAS